ncbi:hypothetical protein ACFL6S_30685 [Candidatus Poribacteria bacterium]
MKATAIVGGRTIVHLLNYNYDFERDRFAEKTDFSLILDDHSVTQATCAVVKRHERIP